MKSTSVIWYFAVGFSMLCVLVPFVGSDHLWKPRFFRWCLIASVVSFVAGLLFEVYKHFASGIGICHRVDVDTADLFDEFSTVQMGL